LKELQHVGTEKWRERIEEWGKPERGGGEGRGGEERRGEMQREREREREGEEVPCRDREERKVLYTCLHKLSKVCYTKPLVTYKFCFASKSLFI
jgi:hypothetical protein